MKKIWIGLIIVVAVVTVAILIFTRIGTKSEEIKIGVITPLSGSSAKYGIDIKRGYDLAVKEINQQNGINGKKLKLIYEDSEGKPDKAVAVAHKLIQQDKVIAVLGPLWSSPTLAVAPIVERNKVVLLSSGASSPKVTNAGDFVFRNEISDAYGAEQSAKLYYNQEFEKIAIIYINNDYGIGVKNVTVKTYRELGGNVVVSEAFEQDAKDFRTQLLKIKEANPEAILIVSYKEAILILTQMKELGIDKQILSTPLFEDSEIIQKVGELAEGAIYSYYGTFGLEGRNGQSKKFKKEFFDTYSNEPGYYSPLGYDAVKILARAIQNADSEKPTDIKQAMYKIKDFPGVSVT